MWLLFLVILLGTLRIARAEPDNRRSTYVDDAPASDDACRELDDEREEREEREERDEADEPDDALDACDDVAPQTDDDLDDDERLFAAEVGDGAVESTNELDTRGELTAGSEGRETEWLEGPDAREAALRSRASWLGRIDVGVTWRRAAPDAGPARHEVLLLATWRL